jgi:nucleotide-binding universal stress UspA family protein
MKRFKNILFCAEGQAGDRFALELATELAKRNDAQLTVFNVVEDLPRELLRLAAAMPLGTLQSMAIEEARDQIERFVSSVPTITPHVTIKVTCGKPCIEIVRAVLRHQHDLVIIVGSARKGIKERIVGSTGMRLMRKCPCPVWVVNLGQKRRFSRILAAVDPDPLDVVRDGMNSKIMELATSLAELENSELHVVHAWQTIDEASLWRRHAEIPVSKVEEWARHISEEHQRMLRDLLARFDLSRVTCQTHLIEGDAGSVIPEVAAKEQIDLIVMGTVARVGLEGYFIGNTAETVLNRVACSVLTIKPEGFVSPVKLD